MPSLTFCASANPAFYVGARPTFVDSEPGSWTVDPALLANALEDRCRDGRPPAAVVVVHLYGQCADLRPILQACRRWGVPLVEDAAEAAGSLALDASGTPVPAGSLGDLGILSFDGSKMITTSMGGALLSNNRTWIDRARKLARQAREPVPHYEHREIGHNYRMSNLLAAVGRSQLKQLEAHVKGRRQVHQWYREELQGLSGLTFQPEATWGRHSRWLTALTLRPAPDRPAPAETCHALRARGVEARRSWKPLHLQPVYRDHGCQVIGGRVSERIFHEGLCLPSSPSLTRSDVTEISTRLKDVLHGTS